MQTPTQTATAISAATRTMPSAHLAVRPALRPSPLGRLPGRELLRPQPVSPGSGSSSRWFETLALVAQHLPYTRRTVHAGERIQVAGDALTSLQIVNAGVVKTVHLSPNGYAQIVGLHFKGDWIGLDAMTDNHFACDAYALDTSEVWRVGYAQLLQATATIAALTRLLHVALSAEISQYRNLRVAMGTLCADARVAHFLLFWTQALADRSLRTDIVALPLTRAEIGSYLGLTLETVSRALNQLARTGLIDFTHKGGRSLAITSMAGLVRFVESHPPKHVLA